MPSHSAELPICTNNKAGEMHALITLFLSLIAPLLSCCLVHAPITSCLKLDCRIRLSCEIFSATFFRQDQKFYRKGLLSLLFMS